MKRIISYNLNGIRSAVGKGLADWLRAADPDIVCFQETKAQPDQLSKDLLEPKDYYTYWNYPARKGYSGVASLTREKPIRVQNGLGIPEFDTEGRVLITEYPAFILMNIPRMPLYRRLEITRLTL